MELSTSLIPSVAISELTRSFTTMNPEIAPITAQARTTSSAMTPIGRRVCSVSQLITTIVSDIISPIDRS